MKIIRLASEMKLPEKWVKYLIDEPETGMGYQIIDVRLKDGQTISDVAAANCEILTMSNGSQIPFSIDDIEDIKVRAR